MTDNKQAEIDRRVAAVNAVYLITPGIRDGLSVIEETRRLRRQNGKPFCSLIAGRSGVGKTRLFERYAAGQPEPPPGTKPVLMLSAPSNIKNEGMIFEAMLVALGEPVIEGQRPLRVIARAERALERHAVELVLLEEASHIVDRKTSDAKTPYRVTDAIKTNLLDTEYPVPLVMSGILVARNIFEINTQMKTRRHRTFELNPYDRDDPSSFAQFKLLLDLLEAAAGFEKRYFLNDEDAARRVHLATGGIHVEVSKLACDATTLVIQRGARGFTKEILAEAFARISDPGPGWTNAFLVATPRAEAAPDESRTTTLHKRRAA
jgi:hypothetical protein